MLTSDRMLTRAEKAAFEEQGYHIVRNALALDEVVRYRQALARVLLLPADHPYAGSLATSGLAPDNCPPDNPRAIWAGFDLPLFDDCFFDLAFHPRIALTVDALIGPDLNLYETSFVSKIPQFPDTFRDWHQDSEYSDPQSNDRNVTVIIFLDDMDGQSGATWVVPGTHKLGPLPHVAPVENVSSGAREVADKERFNAQGTSFAFSAGDALVFLVRLVHKSGPNHSDRSRLSLAYNYVRKDNLDLRNRNRYIGAATPVVRNNRLYVSICPQGREGENQ